MRFAQHKPEMRGDLGLYRPKKVAFEGSFGDDNGFAYTHGSDIVGVDCIGQN